MRRAVYLLVIAMILPACGTEPTPSRSRGASRGQGTTARSARRDAGSAAQPAFVDGERRLMGTVFVVRTLAPRAIAEPAIDAALDEIERLERILSEWIPTSEISRINAAAGGEPVVVGTDTWTVVEEGLAIARESHGAFDLSWAALRGVYDFHDSSPREPDRATIRRLLPLVDYRDIVLDETTHSIRLERRGMALGTGGIAKGYALDRASEILRAAGVEDFMIYGGGQVQVHGRRVDRPWRVGVQHPRENRLVASFEVTDASVATAGDYEHSFFTPDGRRIHHILDLETGLPSTRSISVTVVMPTGTGADAIDTALFVLGPEESLALLARRTDSVDAVIIGSDCVVHTTPGFRERLRFETPLEPGDVLPDCRGRR